MSEKFTFNPTTGVLDKRTQVQIDNTGKDIDLSVTGDILSAAIDTDTRALIDVSQQRAEASKAPSGFEDTQIPYTFNNATGQLQIGVEADWVIWTEGERWLKDSVESITPTVANNSPKYIKYNTSGVLEAQDTPWAFYECQVGVIYRNDAGTPVYTFYPETHGLMDWNSHLLHHIDVGTTKESGLVTTDYTLATATQAAVSYGVSAGVLRDEDRTQAISALVSNGGGAGTVYRWLYKNGSVWTVSNLSADITPIGTTYIQFNDVSSGTGVLTEVTSGRFVNIWIGAQIVSQADYQIIAIVGQKNHATLSDAQAESSQSLDLAGIGSEFNIVKRLTLRTGSAYTGVRGQFRIEDAIDVTGGRSQQIGVSGISPSIHNNLSGRDAADTHPALSITNTPAGSISSTTVQAAINELDTDLTTAKADIDELQRNQCCDNYVKNPEALDGVTDVTVNPLADSSTNVTVAAETSAPLFGVRSFKLTSASTGKWAVGFDLNALDAGLSGRMGEASLVIKGPAVSTQFLSVVDASGNVLATMTGADRFILDENKAQKFSLIFPIPSLPNALKLIVGDTTDRIPDTKQLTIDKLYLGSPKSVSSGGVVTEWQTYTPTGGDQWTANATYSGKWRRVGDTMEIFASIVAGASTPTGGDTGGTRIALPTGYTIDTAKINSATANESVLGTWQGMIVGVGNMGGQVRKHTSNTQFELWTVSPDAGDYKTSHGVLTASQITNGGAQQGKVYAHVTVPIAGWSATDVVTPEATLVEYASNSSATDANDTTSFVNGPAGAVGIIGTTNISAARAKRVRFSTPIKATDSITVEVYDSVSAAWVPIEHNRNGGLSYVKQNTTEYGIFLVGINSTDIDIYFSQYAVPTGATYGSAGLTWDAAGAKQWRVKKTPGSGNQSVYISSPLVADPTTNTIKAKNTSGVDVLSIDGGTDTIATLGKGGTGGQDSGVVVNSGSGTGGEAYIGLQRNGSTVGLLIGDASEFRIRSGNFPITFAPNNVTSGSITTAGAWTLTASSGTTLTVKGSGTTNATICHEWQNSSGDRLGFVDNSGAFRFGKSDADILVHDMFGYLRIKRTVTGTSHTMMQFLDGANDVCGAVEINAVANTTSYVTTSDARKKTDLGEFSALDVVKEMKIHKYQWKHATECPAEIGVYAQELQSTIPYAVSHNEEMDSWGVDYGKLSPIALKAIQEQQALIQQQQQTIDLLIARIEALEGK